MTRSVSESIETESTYCVPISDSSRLILSLPGAVRAGRRTTGRLVRKTRYSQISFRSSASNLETALADAYYAACVMYPQQFQDIDPVEKAGEIFTKLLGSNPYHDLEEAGYAFCQITIGA